MTAKKFTDIYGRMRELTHLFLTRHVSDEEVAEMDSLVRLAKEIDEERARHLQNAIDLERTCMQLGDKVKRLEADLAHAHEELAAIDAQIANSPSSRPPAGEER